MVHGLPDLLHVHRLLLGVRDNAAARLLVGLPAEEGPLPVLQVSQLCHQGLDLGGEKLRGEAALELLPQVEPELVP